MPALMVTGVVLIPFVYMLTRFMDFAELGGLAGSSSVAVLTRTAVMNSLVQGMISGATSFAAGMPLGIFMGKYEFRLKRLLRSVAIIPFFLPSIVVVTAFISSFGPGSPLQALIGGSALLSGGLVGIVAVNTFFNAPLVAMMTMLAVEREDIALDEAARTLGASAMRRFRSIWGRDCLLAAGGGALLAFLYSFAGFTAPLIIGGPRYFTLEAWIYFTVRTLHDLPLAAFMSFVESTALLLPALLYLLFASSTRRVYGAGRVPAASGRRRDTFFIAGAGYVAAWVVAEGYVLASVLYASFSVGGGRTGLLNYAQLFGGRATSALGISAGAGIVNTLFYGLMTSLLVSTVGLFWIYGRRRLASRLYAATDTLQFLPLVVSAVIFSLSLTVAFEYTTTFAYDWLLIIVAQSVLAIPIVLRVIQSGFAAIPRSYSEAALTLRGNAFFEIELPLARSTLASALMFGFAMSLGEFTATNFLASTAYMPIGVQIYGLRTLRFFGASEAAAAILLIMSVVSFYIVQRLGEAFVAVR